MHRPVLRLPLPVPLLLLLPVPTAASAHGVNDAAGKSVPEFVWLASHLPARFASERAQRVASTGIVVLGILAAVLVVDRANRPAPAAAGPYTSGERVDTLPYGQGPDQAAVLTVTRVRAAR